MTGNLPLSCDLSFLDICTQYALRIHVLRIAFIVHAVVFVMATPPSKVYHPSRKSLMISVHDNKLSFL